MVVASVLCIIMMIQSVYYDTERVVMTLCLVLCLSVLILMDAPLCEYDATTLHVIIIQLVLYDSRRTDLFYMYPY